MNKLDPSHVVSRSFRPNTPDWESWQRDLLLDLVTVSSETGNHQGNSEMFHRLAIEAGRLDLGLKIHEPLSLEIHLGPQSGPRIYLIGHTDTVLPANSTEPFRFDGDWLEGSGTIDDKGGIVIGLSALRKLALHYGDTALPVGISLLLSPSEETGSLSLHAVYRNLAQTAVAVLGLEPALDSGNVISERRGNRWYDVEIRGHGGHSGRTQGEHVSAILEAAHKTLALEELTSVANGVRVCTNSLRSATDKFNMICDHVNMKIDSRFSTRAQSTQLHESICQILDKSFTRSQVTTASHPGAHRTHSTCTTRFSIADDCPVFERHPEFDSFFETYQQTVQKLENRNILAEPGGGASDVNHFGEAHVFMIDGLGAVGAGMHTQAERIWLPSLVSRSTALFELLKTILQKQ